MATALVDFKLQFRRKIFLWDCNRRLRCFGFRFAGRSIGNFSRVCPCCPATGFAVVVVVVGGGGAGTTFAAGGPLGVENVGRFGDGRHWTDVSEPENQDCRVRQKIRHVLLNQEKNLRH